MHPLLTPLFLMGLALGAVLIGSGCWVVWSMSARERFARKLSEPTRHVLGIAMILGGYHLLAYCSPDHWFPLKVPADRWYLVAGGIILALGLSFATDALGRVSQDGNEGSPPDPR